MIIRRIILEDDQERLAFLPVLDPPMELTPGDQFIFEVLSSGKLRLHRNVPGVPRWRVGEPINLTEDTR